MLKYIQPGSKIVLATHNRGKLREMQDALSNIEIEIIPQDHFAVPAVDEIYSTFVENALLKARHAVKHTGLPAIADDSGLHVEALNGAPGVFSARYAGSNASDQNNIEKLLEALKNIPDEERTAQFICVTVFLRHENDPLPLIFQASWEGKILKAPRGKQGFGYDPVFYVPTHDCSAAELPLVIKNQISHRGRALQELVHYLKMAIAHSRIAQNI